MVAEYTPYARQLGDFFESTARYAELILGGGPAVCLFYQGRVLDARLLHVHADYVDLRVKITAELWVEAGGYIDGGAVDLGLLPTGGRPAYFPTFSPGTVRRFFASRQFLEKCATLTISVDFHV